MNCLQNYLQKHEVTSIDLKYYDRHAETPKYRMPYNGVDLNIFRPLSIKDRKIRLDISL